MNRNQYFSMLAVLTCILQLLTACTSLTLTNKNATEPVMAGQIQQLSGQKDKGNAVPQNVMASAKTWSVLFLLVFYITRDNTAQNFGDLADAQYASVVEKTRCTHRVQSVTYETYSHFSLLYSAYMNKMAAESDGTVKCAR